MKPNSVDTVGVRGELRRVFAQLTPACYHAFGLLVGPKHFIDYITLKGEKWENALTEY
jgi:hypothetical protein